MENDDGVKLERKWMESIVMMVIEGCERLVVDF